MSMSPFTVRPAYTGSDYLFTVTCDAMGSATPMGQWTLTATLYDPLGDAVTSTITLTVLSASALTLSVGIVGQNLAFGDYTLRVTRTNAGQEAVVYTGVLEVTDPLNQLGWGAGFVTP